MPERLKRVLITCLIWRNFGVFEKAIIVESSDDFLLDISEGLVLIKHSNIASRSCEIVLSDSRASSFQPLLSSIMDTKTNILILTFLILLRPSFRLSLCFG